MFIAGRGVTKRASPVRERRSPLPNCSFESSLTSKNEVLERQMMRFLGMCETLDAKVPVSSSPSAASSENLVLTAAKETKPRVQRTKFTVNNTNPPQSQEEVDMLCEILFKEEDLGLVASVVPEHRREARIQ